MGDVYYYVCLGPGLCLYMILTIITMNGERWMVNDG